MSEIQVKSARLNVTYTGKKEMLVAAGIADEQDFPVWPKRKSHSGTGDYYSWSIYYQKGGGFTVSHGLLAGEGSLSFVQIVDGKKCYWADDPKHLGIDSEGFSVGRDRFIELMVYVRHCEKIGADSDFSFLMQEIEKNLPEHSEKRWSFLELRDLFLKKALVYFSFKKAA